MSHNDDPFQEEGIRKPEKGEALPEFLDADSTPDEDDDDIIDLIDLSEEFDDEEVFELTETVDDMTVPTPDDVAAAAAGTDEDVIDLSSVADTGSGQDEDILDLSDEDVLDLHDETVEASDLDEGIIDLSDHEARVQDADATDAGGVQPAETAATDEDKEIMELIDDIQSSLNRADEPGEAQAVQETEPDDDDHAVDPPVEASDVAAEVTYEKPIILGDEETIEEEDSSYSDSDFVDNLGLDLTSEFSKELFEGGSKASALSMERLEELMEKVLNKMLSDENSLLVRTITQAVNKESQ